MPERACSTSSSASSFVLSRNLDHPHLKGRFKLRLWVPVEQVGLVIGKGGKGTAAVKRESSVKSIETPPPDAGSHWAPVVVTGDPTATFRAYQAISKVVEEVDDAVAVFPLHPRRHRSIVGPGGSTIKRISADNAVRVFIPARGPGPGHGHGQPQGQGHGQQHGHGHGDLRPDNTLE
ncbi:unnamed protein product, partial [Discosporangium mesarthrocarpum]